MRKIITKIVTSVIAAMITMTALTSPETTEYLSKLFMETGAYSDSNNISCYAPVVRKFTGTYGVPGTETDEHGNNAGTFCRLIDFNNDGNSELYLAGRNSYGGGHFEIYMLKGNTPVKVYEKEMNLASIDDYNAVTYDTVNREYYLCDYMYEADGDYLHQYYFNGDSFEVKSQYLLPFGDSHSDEYITVKSLKDEIMFGKMEKKSDGEIINYGYGSMWFYADNAFSVSNETYQKILGAGTEKETTTDPLSSENTYEAFFINAHTENNLKKDGLWYSSYLKAPSGNELYKIAGLMEFDSKYGALNSNYMLDKEKAFFDLNMYELKNTPFDTETYYRLALAQLITEVYSTEEMTAATANALADVLNMTFESGSETENFKELSEIMEGLGISCDTVSSVTELIDIIRKTDDLKVINDLAGSIGNQLSIAGLIIDSAADLSEEIEDIGKYIQYTVYYKAFLYANEEVKSTFLLLEKNTDDDVLRKVLREYTGILNAENTSSYISKSVLSFILDKSVEGGEAALSKIGGEVLNYFIYDVAGGMNPYFKIWQGARLVVTIENSVVDKFMETEKLYHYVALFVTYNKVHQALYKSYEEIYPEFISSTSLENAKILHLLQQFYKSTDITAIEAANDYLPLFIKNNSMMHGLSLSGWVRDILNCELNEVFSELEQLYHELDNLEEQYTECNCCVSEKHWKEYVAAAQYIRDVISNRIENAAVMTSKELLDWYEKKKLSLNEWYQNAIDVIFIACPVTVRVYDDEDNLIAVLSDDGVETSSYYNRFFITCSETSDEITESKEINSYNVLDTKAKILILPHDSSDFRYEIIGDSNGKMDIHIFEIESIDTENWFENTRLKFSGENIPVKKHEVFVTEKSGSKYALKNITDDESDEEIMDSVNFVPVIAGIVVISAAVLCIGFVLLVRHKKKRNR